MVQGMDEWLRYTKEYELSGTYGGRRVIQNGGGSSERLARVVFGCQNSNIRQVISICSDERPSSSCTTLVATQ